MPPFSHTRHDQGNKTEFVTQYTKSNGLGHTSHFRKGPETPFKPADVFKPLPVCSPDQAHQNPHYPLQPVDCGTAEPVDPVETPVSQPVPDSGAFMVAALLSVAIFKALCRGRGSK